MPNRSISLVSARIQACAAEGAAVIALFPGFAPAQSLQEALNAAYNNIPALQAERATLRATDENVPQALANWRPTVQVTGSEGITHEAIRQDCDKIFQGQ